MSSSVKTMLLVFGAILLLIAGGATIYTISMPQLSIEIVGDHNPTLNTVLINGEVLAPTGTDGRFYSSRIKAGNAQIKLYGPFISDYQEEDSVELFSRKTVVITTVNRSPEDIIRETVSGNQITVSNLRSFPKSGALVASLVVDGISSDDSFPTLLSYSKKEYAWQDITKEYINNRSAFVLDKEVLKYFGELASD